MQTAACGWIWEAKVKLAKKAGKFLTRSWKIEYQTTAQPVLLGAFLQNSITRYVRASVKLTYLEFCVTPAFAEKLNIKS